MALLKIENASLVLRIEHRFTNRTACLIFSIGTELTQTLYMYMRVLLYLHSNGV